MTRERQTHLLRLCVVPARVRAVGPPDPDCRTRVPTVRSRDDAPGIGGPAVTVFEIRLMDFKTLITIAFYYTIAMAQFQRYKRRVKHRDVEEYGFGEGEMTDDDVSHD